MAEEEVVAVAAAAASPAPSDHKRKLEDLEPEAPEQARPSSDDSNAKPDAANQGDGDVSSDTKRFRLDDRPEGLGNARTASENGYQVEKADETLKENDEPITKESIDSEEAQPTSKEVTEKETSEQPSADNREADETQEHPIEHVEGSVLDEGQEPANEGTQPPSTEDAQQGDDSSAQQEQPTSANETITRRMEVPNNKVGVLIGKAGDTIKYLQYNSGARIQITRDADADPYSASRPVEIVGTLDNINKAEKLINAVIAEADAGGSPSLVARGLATAQAAAAAEQIQIQVPNEKVGLIIGRGGETIKGLQTRSGARIQLIPQHLPEGDDSKERTVRVTGDKRQIEMAREMIKEVMNQTVRPSPLSGGFNQQAYRPRGPSGPPQWGPRVPHMSQPTSYEYQQRGPYPSHNPQYPHSAYGGYPQHMGSRSGFNSGWEQRPPSGMQGMSHGSGYDYYGGQGGHLSDGPVSAQHSAPIPSHAPGPSNPSMGPPPSQANYNYGQPQGDYGHPVPYTQSMLPQQGYGHGYDEPKYENHAPTQHGYGHGGSQQMYQPSSVQQGYGSQQQYSKPPSYGIPSQGPPSQPYGPPRSSQPGDVPYQGSVQAQSYGQNMPSQQPYPYASSGPNQQAYPPYGSASAAEGYNQAPAASGAGYPQQGGQAVANFSQSGSQQAPGYGQVGPAGYGQYPSSQQGYPEQSAPNAAGYGYQGPQDPGYAGGPASAYGAPPTGQPNYTQPTTTQQTYDQSVPQSAAYGGGVQTSASVVYAKTVSPQPAGYTQYDSAQMYAAPR